MIHELKIKTLFFNLIVSGAKTFELRKNDRNYKVGDYLALNEIALTENEDVPFPDDDWEYTGRSTIFQITHVFEDSAYLQPGYVALGIKPCHIIRYNEPQIIEKKVINLKSHLACECK